MSKYKRPAGMEHRNDPEEQYRAGYQHGAQAVREFIKNGKLDLEKLAKWIEVDLQKWRHDKEADPAPPPIASRRSR